MRPSLNGVDLKLRRAKECLHLLDQARGDVLPIQHDRVVGQYNPEAREYVVRLLGDLPPLEWGIRVGEYAHALRSALDNLLWQLIELRGGVPGIETKFPIYEEETNRKGQSGRAGRERVTAGVSPVDFAFIEDSQPFKAGLDGLGRPLAKWHPLAMLSYLNNVDKHHFIHASFMTAAFLQAAGAVGIVRFSDMSLVVVDHGTPVSVVPIIVGSGRISPIDMVGSWPVLRWKANGGIIAPLGFGSSDDPAEVARATDIDEPQAEVEVKPPLAFEVSFSDRVRPISIFDLVAIETEVVRIVDHFRSAFL